MIPDRRAAVGAAMRLLEFFAYVARGFHDDRCLHAAAALAYTTLLALVPLLTVAFVTLTAFPAFQQLGEQMQQFVFTNFVPALGDTVRDYMNRFAAKASGLRAVGLAVLVVTVLGLMATVDGALNAIWHVRTRRRRVLNFLVYWAVLTLGPLLLGTGLAVSSYLISLPLLSDVETSLGLKGKLLAALPASSSFLAFVLLYLFVPNRPVPVRHAAAGAALATILFELAKRGFALYITTFPTHEVIYGAFAAVPIFLLWIYLCWVIVLFGAEVTRSLATFQPARVGPACAARSVFVDAYRVLARLLQVQRAGRAADERELMSGDPVLGDRRLAVILERLAAQRWIVRSEDGGWVVLRDLDAATLLDLYRTLPGPLPAPSGLRAAEPAMQRLIAVLGDSHARAEAAMRVPLRELLAPGAREHGAALSAGS